jgi:hypothetical protein
VRMTVHARSRAAHAPEMTATHCSIRVTVTDVVGTSRRRGLRMSARLAYTKQTDAALAEPAQTLQVVNVGALLTSSIQRLTAGPVCSRQHHL